MTTAYVLRFDDEDEWLDAADRGVFVFDTLEAAQDGAQAYISGELQLRDKKLEWEKLSDWLWQSHAGSLVMTINHADSNVPRGE